MKITENEEKEIYEEKYFYFRLHPNFLSLISFLPLFPYPSRLDFFFVLRNNLLQYYHKIYYFSVCIQSRWKFLISFDILTLDQWLMACICPIQFHRKVSFSPLLRLGTDQDLPNQDFKCLKSVLPWTWSNQFWPDMNLREHCTVNIGIMS